MQVTGDLVGVGGFEPPTSRSRTVRSTKLSHTPIRNEDLCGGRTDNGPGTARYCSMKALRITPVLKQPAIPDRRREKGTPTPAGPPCQITAFYPLCDATYQ